MTLSIIRIGTLAFILWLTVRCKKEEVLQTSITPINHLSWRRVNHPSDGTFNRGFSIETSDYVYLGGGSTSKTMYNMYSNSFWRIHKETETWEKLVDLPYSKDASTCGFALGDSVFLIRDKEMHMYNPITKMWVKKSMYPGKGVQDVSATSCMGKGYVGLGGINETRSSFTDLWEYNPSDDAWTKKKTFPGFDRHGAVAFNYGNKCYFGIGRCYPVSDMINFNDKSTKEYLRDIMEYDPSSDEWKTVASFPDDDLLNGELVPHFKHNEDVFFIGGYSSNNNGSNVWKLNLRTFEFTVCTPLQYIHAEMSTALKLNNNAFIIIDKGSDMMMSNKEIWACPL